MNSASALLSSAGSVSGMQATEVTPPASAAAVQLALDEARAWTELGDRDQAAGARRLAALTRAMLPGAGLPLPAAGPAGAAAS